jgi:hypothetical protein
VAGIVNTARQELLRCARADDPAQQTAICQELRTLVAVDR